jgi:HlyD family secretion protein
LPQKAIADTDYDLARANWRVAKANVDVGKATIKQAEAALAMAQTNLDYCIIKSPVNGIVIARRVNVGQTVVAAMNAASICLLAKDLQRMQIWPQVNEADIGRIHVGLPVTFTIATYPGEVFRGKVAQVRLNGQSTQNVITYTVVVSTDNPPSPDYPYGKVFPYMTADVKFEVERRPDVLLVPNAALRWKPQDAQIAPDAKGKSSQEKKTAKDEKPESSDAGKKEHGARSRLWVQDGAFVRPVNVRVGASDGAVTEVSGKEVKEGMKVVIGESRSAEQAANSEETTNPLLPKIRPGGTPQRPKQQ